MLLKHPSPLADDSSHARCYVGLKRRLAAAAAESAARGLAAVKGLQQSVVQVVARTKADGKADPLAIPRCHLRPLLYSLIASVPSPCWRGAHAASSEVDLASLCCHLVTSLCPSCCSKAPPAEDFSQVYFDATSAEPSAPSATLAGESSQQLQRAPSAELSRSGGVAADGASRAGMQGLNGLDTIPAIYTVSGGDCQGQQQLQRGGHGDLPPGSHFGEDNSGSEAPLPLCMLP